MSGMTLNERVYDHAPAFIKNVLVTAFDLMNLVKRRSGNYRSYKKQYRMYESLDLDEILSVQAEGYKRFIQYLVNYSEFYRLRLEGISGLDDLSNLQKIPILEKDELKKNLGSIMTIAPSKGLTALTGGTTGKPIKVVFTKDNFRERIAILDNFRERYGFYYGRSKVAWFSGRKILSKNDEKRKRFWRYDPLMHIRYYSTFHLSKSNIPYYLEDLVKYKPMYMSGFPSAFHELADYIESSGSQLGYQLNAIFTTSETLLPHIREKLERVFTCKVYDQYASAEGAPFIYECLDGKMHYCLPSGLIEVVDSNHMPSVEGELIVTSFTTYGTPLLRYRIGDYGVLSGSKCSCGSNYPVFERLEGRATDFIFSQKRGKLFNSQVGDCVKADIIGLLNYQVIQETASKLSVHILTTEDFNSDDQEKIVSKLRDRTGPEMDITVRKVDDLLREKSGKVRLIVNKALDEIAELEKHM